MTIARKNRYIAAIATQVSLLRFCAAKIADPKWYVATVANQRLCGPIINYPNQRLCKPTTQINYTNQRLCKSTTQISDFADPKMICCDCCKTKLVCCDHHDSKQASFHYKKGILRLSATVIYNTMNNKQQIKFETNQRRHYHYLKLKLCDI